MGKRKHHASGGSSSGSDIVRARQKYSKRDGSGSPPADAEGAPGEKVVTADVFGDDLSISSEDEEDKAAKKAVVEEDEDDVERYEDDKRRSSDSDDEKEKKEKVGTGTVPYLLHFYKLVPGTGRSGFFLGPLVPSLFRYRYGTVR